MKYLYLLLIICIAASGCTGTCRSKEKCIPKGELFAKFNGFTHDEIDTIILHQYKAGSNFTDGITSSITDSYSHLRYLSTHSPLKDTPAVYKLVDSSNGNRFYEPTHFWLAVNDEYEYEIEVPAAGRKYRISNIVLDGEAQKTVKYECNSSYGRQCFRNLISYAFEGQNTSAASGGTMINRNLDIRR